MPASCDPNWDFSNLVFSDLILYFSYLIFFAPYLLKLISFLSPLFLTTSLLSLAFLTASVVQKLRDYQNEEESQSFDDLGMYETLFGSSVMEERENPVEEEEKAEELEKLEESEGIAVDKVEVNSNSGKKSQMEEKRMENFLKILDEFEKMASNGEGKKRPDPSRGPRPDKVVEKQKAVLLSISNGSDATINGAKSYSHRITPRVDEERGGGGGERKFSLKAESSRALMEAANSYGSMRREKEWKRTLACKLFEERHNVDGGEGMDSLWEAYEIDSNKQKNETKKKKMTTMKTKKIDLEFIDDKHEEEDEVEPPLCCLQALKLSTGKMNLGVGIPNLVKISKAIKGIGWLHSVSKHSKKVHNNNGERY